MLAFAFRTFSVEADLAKGLLLFHPDQPEPGEESGATLGDASARDDEGEEDDLGAEKAISAENMLSIGMSGLARPLKSRILQVVSTLSRRPDDEEVDSDDGVDDDLDEQGTAVRTRVTHLYEICGLLLFYISTMEKGVKKIQAASAGVSIESLHTNDDDKNPLVECLLECVAEASKGYEATVRVYSAMLDQLSAITGDSEASLVQQMVVLLADVRRSSPGFSSDVECPLDCQRSLSVEWLTETLVETCVDKCTALDDAIALKQALEASKSAGMNVSSAEKLDLAIEQKESILVQEMVQSEVVVVLDVCGLGSLVDAWKRWKSIQTSPQSVSMALYPGLSVSEIESGMRDFFSSLYSPPLPSLEAMIKDPVARRLVRSKIAESVCQEYAGLYQSITASGSGYSNVSFLVHKPDEVATLFSV
jgi:conserved oligomeric Golgi complex subunit 6